MIVNLKRLNKFVDYKHFKSNSLQNVLELIRPGVYMASIDLKDAFYSVPIHKKHQGYLTFFVEEYLKFVYMPNEYGTAMRIFTKISKIPFSILREKGFLSVVYVDDSYLQGDDYEDCFSNVPNTIEILRCLGFPIHPDKSKFIPTKCITYLGFILNYVQMTITLTMEKKQKNLNLCQEILGEDVVTIRFLSKLIGDLVAAFPAVTLGPFYYRALETDKTKALQQSNGNYDALVRLSNEAKKELCWWITNIMSSFQHICLPDPDITIYTDSSTIGSGVTDGYNPSGGRWKADEINHINVLELKAIFIGVLTYCKGKNYKHVRVMSDNITAVSYVNNKGRIKSEFCNEIAKELWVWCTSQNMWISAAHIPGTQNTEADTFSRNFSEAIEWKLSTHLFQKVSSMFGNPTLDLFASPINHQIDRCISWKPDPKALAKL